MAKITHEAPQADSTATPPAASREAPPTEHRERWLGLVQSHRAELSTYRSDDLDSGRDAAEPPVRRAFREQAKDWRDLLCAAFDAGVLKDLRPPMPDAYADFGRHPLLLAAICYGALPGMPAWGPLPAYEWGFMRPAKRINAHADHERALVKCDALAAWLGDTGAHARLDARFGEGLRKLARDPRWGAKRIRLLDAVTIDQRLKALALRFGRLRRLGLSKLEQRHPNGSRVEHGRTAINTQRRKVRDLLLYEHGPCDILRVQLLTAELALIPSACLSQRRYEPPSLWGVAGCIVACSGCTGWAIHVLELLQARLSQSANVEGRITAPASMASGPQFRTEPHDEFADVMNDSKLVAASGALRSDVQRVVAVMPMPDAQPMHVAELAESAGTGRAGEYTAALGRHQLTERVGRSGLRWNARGARFARHFLSGNTSAAG